MKTGFVPALGTPLDEKGELLEDSYKKEIEMMIGCGAVGLLSMGSMGIQAFIWTTLLHSAISLWKWTFGRHSPLQ